MTLVTGYRGLAEVLIQSLSDAGHRLSVLVRQREAVENLQKRFPQHLFALGDMADFPSLDRWIEQSLQHYGQIHALINNAAVTGPGGRLHEIEFAEFESSMRINLLAPIYLMQRAIPSLLQSGEGTVINLSGGGATNPRPFFSAYATAKCGLVRQTETIAEEYPELRFYAISPGAMKTPMMEQIARFGREKIGREHDDAQKRLEKGGEDPGKAATLMRWLIENRPGHLSGKLISAIWDEYENAPERRPELGWWTLRRVDEKCVDNLKKMVPELLEQP